VQVVKLLYIICVIVFTACVILFIIGGKTMKIITTPRELIDKGLWDRYCEISGMSVYAVNEGYPDDTPISLDLPKYKPLILRLCYLETN